MLKKHFTMADQIAFANLSGDNNPLHVDPVAARRYLFGQPVVHGVHSILWGLEQWLTELPFSIHLQSIKAYFLKPILLDTPVHYAASFQQANRLRIEVLSDSVVSTRIEIEWIPLTSGTQTVEFLEKDFPQQSPPRVLTEKAVEEAAGVLNLSLNPDAMNDRFPHLSRCVSPLLIAVLLGTTRLVGVECPGLNSVYSEVELFSDDTSLGEGLRYQVTHLDKRFGLVSMAIAAPGITGEVKAFIRPTPKQQASYISLKEQVNPNEFKNQRALIVGGSRGLGEVVAKLLAAGGAKVVFTYHCGKADAQRIVDEITAYGGEANCFGFDVLNTQSNPLVDYVNGFTATHLYYFATPFIVSGVKGTFSAELFSKFCNYYINGFMNTMNQFKGLGIKTVFYPSTVYVDELPINMGEYVAAKMAGEVLCKFLEKTHRDLTIYKPQLPRMATDQTLSLLPIANLDPVPVMLENLRSFQELSSYR